MPIPYSLFVSLTSQEILFMLMLSLLGRKTKGGVRQGRGNYYKLNEIAKKYVPLKIYFLYLHDPLDGF